MISAQKVEPEGQKILLLATIGLEWKKFEICCSIVLLTVLWCYRTLSLKHVYFQGSTQPELSSLDSASGGHNVKTDENKADESVNQELHEKKTISNEPNFYHKVSFENRTYTCEMPNNSNSACYFSI
jgi:hypothetical protein